MLITRLHDLMVVGYPLAVVGTMFWVGFGFDSLARTDES